MAVRSIPLFAALLVGFACRVTPPGAIDPALASCIPAGSSMIAGVNLAELRASPVFRQMPPSMRQPLDAFQDASYILIAGKDTGLLLAARGKFAQAPPGSTLVAPDLALAGTPGLVSSAIQQHKTGTSGAPALLSHASRRPMWIAADGTATFPLSGNTRNLNRFLHFTEYLTVTIQFGSPADIEITAVCRGPAEARHFEDSARAFLSLANLSGTPQIRPEGLTVRIAFAVSAATLQEWIGSALRP